MIANHRIGVWALVPCLLALGSAGCGGGKQSPSTDIAKAPWEVRVESPLDTVAVTVPTEGDASGDVAASIGAPVLEAPQVTESQPAVAAPASVVPPTVPSATVYTPGWRVQIFVSASMAGAEEVARKARQHFTEPVYVEFEPPYYKVRLGDFLSKEDARHMANRAKADDYQTYIVEALVVRPQR